MAMTPPEIHEFESLIEPYLNGAKVKSYQSNFLTKPGENYGAIVLKILVKIEQSNGKLEDLNIIAKLPPANEFLWKIFRPELTFEKETRCYTHLSKELQKLQQEADVPQEDLVDVLPKCYGARISLDESVSQADKNAALLMENLNFTGYYMEDRIKGFKYDQTLVILKNLAKFHAVSIALRLKKPDLFNSSFRPYLCRFNPDEGLSQTELDDLINTAASDLKLVGCTPAFVHYIRSLIDVYYAYMNDKDNYQDTIFTTVTHSDLWVNNMLLKNDTSGKASKVKFVDFQIVQYDSLVHDLLFFLFSSVQVHILEDCLDELFEYYYANFLKFFKQTGCDVTPYKKERFFEEIDRLSSFQYIHVILMLRVVYLKRDSINDFGEINNDAFTEAGIDDNYYVVLRKVTDIFQKRNWLQKL